jgi:hypothetical protein
VEGEVNDNDWSQSNRHGPSPGFDNSKKNKKQKTRPAHECWKKATTSLPVKKEILEQDIKKKSLFYS